MPPAARRLLEPLQVAFVRVIGSVLQLGLSLVLAHLSGTALLGRFLFFVAIANLCAAVGGGMPNLMLRYASTGGADARAHVGWLWRHSTELALLCVVAAGALAVAGERLPRDLALAVGVLLMQRMSSAALKASGRPNLGVLLDTAFYPAVVLAAALVIDRWTGAVSVEPLRLSYVAAVGGAALLATVLTWSSPGSPHCAWTAPRRTPRAVYAEIGTVTGGAVANIVSSNAPLALAPTFLGPGGAGAFGLALRVAGFATTILVSLSAYFGPAFARATSREELMHIRRRSQYACLALYLPVPLVLLLLPTDWLERISPGLGSIKILVLVLSVGYVVNAATGLASTVLLMRGWSGAFSLTSVGNAALTVVALVVGGALGGALGMAVGLSAAMAVSNLWIFAVSTRRVRAMTAQPALEGGPA